MLFGTKTMLSYEHFSSVNKDFEGLDKGYKSRAKWCELYTKANMKETIRI